MDRFKSLAGVLCFCLVAVAAFALVASPTVAVAQCSAGYVLNSCGSQLSPSFDVNLPCAVQAASAVAACRAAGGRFFGCAIEGFGVYLSCNGGLRQQRRQARSRGRQIAAMNYARRNPSLRCR